MNKKIPKIISTLIIILITLICISMTSFASEYTTEYISNAIKNGSFLNMNIEKGDQVTSPDCTRIGYYCIKDVDGGNGSGVVKSIIDLTEDDNVYVNSKKVSVSNSQINRLKAMAYYAKSSVDNNETGVYDVNESSKYRLAIIARVYILPDKENFSSEGVGWSLEGDWIRKANEYCSKANIEDKNYKARFILLSVGVGQDQIIFAAEESDGKGNLKIHKEDEENKTNLSGVKFIIKNNNKDKYLQKQGDKINWVTEKNATTFTTNTSGEISIENIPVGEYTVRETNNPNYGYSNENLYNKKITLKANETVTINATNSKITGNLFIEKRDADVQNKKLSGVTFIIQDGQGKYLKITKAANGEGFDSTNNTCTGIVHVQNMVFVDNKDQATKFITNSNGMIEIYNILRGNYNVTEDSVGNNWQYEVNDELITWEYESKHQVEPITKNGNGKTAKINVYGRASYNTPESANSTPRDNEAWDYLIFNNRKKYVKISGYAFEDDIKSKDDSRNNLYDENTNSADRKLEGIKVVLHIIEDGEDKEVQVKRTNANGEYLFDSYEEDGKTKKIEIDELKNMYVEFVYNGMGYEVTKIAQNPENISDNSTHVVENKTKNSGRLTRQQFNNKYATIENNKSKDIDGAITNLSYNRQGHISRLKYNNIWNGEGKPPVTDINLDNNFIMTANTDDVHEDTTYAGKPYILGLRITEEDIRKMPKEDDNTIKNINLGLYERDMPDIAIMKDLHDVKMTINGKTHVYEYSQRFLNAGEYGGEGFNVGVKFGEEYGYKKMSYSRPVYKEDFLYEEVDESKKDRELRVFVTYQISMKNQSTNLKAKVNSIVDYYDSRYTLTKVGTGVNEGNITGEVNLPKSDYYKEKYQKVIIDLDKVMNPQEVNDIYVQFELNRDAVINILNSKENLDNVVEINSYSIYDENGKVYAGIDNDSNPGNADPEDANKDDKASFEDDTDSAPGLLLKVAGNSRTLSGKVFLDSTPDELMPGKERIDINLNGKYEDGEQGISGVEVSLIEVTNINGKIEQKQDGKVYKTKTINLGNSKYGFYKDEKDDGIYYNYEIYDDNKKNEYEYISDELENGEFLISKFIPGDYVMTYTWGNETYIVNSDGTTEKLTVQEYKGTIWTKDNIKEKYLNGIVNEEDLNKFWYKNIDPRYSDAMDDYELRQKIDREEKDANGEVITKMNSTTPEMNIEIEITSTTTTTFEDKFIPEGYNVEHVDFGIVKRPIQALNLNKKVKNIKIATAKGQIIVDFNINEDGTYEDVKGVTYMAPSANNSPQNGLIRLELDSELLQSAKMNVTYAISVKNNSEIDYDSKDYYLYGELAEGENANDKIVKLKPEKIYDYIDQGFEFNKNDNLDAENNPIWELKETKEYNDEEVKYTFIEEAYSEYREDTVDDEGNMIEKEGYEYYRGDYKEIFESWKQETLEKRQYKEKAREYKLDNRNILELKIDIDNLTPGQEVKIQELKVKKDLSNSNEIDLSNDSEITKISRNTETGSKITPSKSVIYTRGEDVRITPPTGKKDHNIEIIIITISSLIIIATGIIFIKKKILN